jgi:thiol:disulfide interchange protein DsbD
MQGVVFSMRSIFSNRRTILSVTGAFVVAVALAGCSTAPAPAPVANGNDVNKAELAKKTLEPTDKNMKSITWLTSYDKALTQAKADNKPVMIDFYADWCTACKYLDKNIYTAPNVIKKSKTFINLKIDTDKDTEIASRYKVYNLPTLIFLDGNGKVLWRLEGAPASTDYFIQTMQKAQNQFADQA